MELGGILKRKRHAAPLVRRMSCNVPRIPRSRETEGQVGTDGKMDVHLDVSTAGYAGRFGVLEGPTGRRARSEADKARIAAESLMPGVQGADGGGRTQVWRTRWQVYDWRRRLRQGQLVLPESMAPQRTMRPPKSTQVRRRS